MKPESKTYSATVGGELFTFETGKLAGQAGGSVTVRVGDSIVFAAATMGGIRDRHRLLPPLRGIRRANVRQRQNPRLVLPPRRPTQ